MAGHSKFKNIQFRKGAQDKKRGKIFAKLGREITTAAKLGSPDPTSNSRLRLAIQTARSQNMPKDNIDRAIKRSTEQGGEDYENVRYEGFGPDGIGIIIEALTDNRNRTASEVRSTFSKSGGNLGETGSVSFMFDRVGSIEFTKEVGDDDAVMEAAIEAGAEDCNSDDGGHEIICEAEELHEISKALEQSLGEAKSAKIIWRPHNTIDIDDDKGEKILRLMDALDDNDDVQTVYANFEVSESLLEIYNA